MNDQELTTAVRQSFHGVRMNVPAEQIVSRSHAIRASAHRRLATCVAAGTAAVAVVLSLSLTGTFGSAPGNATSTIRTTAFTLAKHPNGTATLTINAQVLLEPGTLQNDLRHDGIPAIVTTGSFCSSDPTPLGFSRAVRVTTPPGAGEQTVTINPAAMPAGTELSFGTFQNGTSVLTGAALISTGSHACASTPPIRFLPAGGLVLRLARGPGEPGAHRATHRSSA
jgi:hypothetical protein